MRKSPEQLAEMQKLTQLSRLKNGQIVFISLFTSVLALFVIIAVILDINANTETRSYQKLVNKIYQQVQIEKSINKLDWLVVENTVSKGVKLTFDTTILAKKPLFSSARAKLNPDFLPSLNKLVNLISALDLANFTQKNKGLVANIIEPSDALLMTIRIEGHTDSNKLAATALYQSNVELSSFRAYALMDYIRLYTSLPAKHFSIAGYGNFKPISDDASEAVNRRVELYIVPHILYDKVKGGL